MDRRVLVIGGGIGGVQAGLDLAQMGIQVTLVEEKPSIGGRMAQLDKTFPTNDCSTCILSPKLVEFASHPNVEIFSLSTVEYMEKRENHFQARIRRWARFVDEHKCTACGMCAEKCPVKVPDTFNKNITTSKCISIPYAQAVPAVYRIDKEHCLYLTKGKCGLCKKVCPAGAVDFEQEDTVETRNFHSVIVAAGAEEYAPRIRPEYGYGIYKNVVTSIEYERFLSASGPTSGNILRPSDGKAPSRIAFLQCVGSRDTASGEYDYCSSFCCMQATKDAIITQEHNRGTSCSIFYIDIRAFGKDFDRFVDRARTEYAVEYIKSRVSEIIEAADTRNLIVKFITPDGKLKAQEFDLVVLSVGIKTPEKLRHFFTGQGVELGEYGFCQFHPFHPGETNVDGIYACGTVMGPMDIPETVVSASAVCALASRGLLSPDTGSDIKREKPSELDIEGKPLNIGVFVCHCGVNIGAVVDVPSVVEHSRSLPNVRYAQDLLYACSQDSIQLIINTIKKYDLNRVVIASCSPRTHEPLFQSCIEGAGLNRHLLQMANIRDQCSWVHRESPDLASQKAKDLVRMAVGKSRFLKPLYESESSMNKACLVIGGGIAGMTAALSIADNGFQVYLIEKEDRLGGNLLKINYLLKEQNPHAALSSVIRRVEEHPKIEVFLQARIERIQGYVGNFTTDFSIHDEQKSVEHGTVIVATGAKEHETESYGYREDPYVVTQREFETILKRRNPLMKYVQDIVMIQCVDSREGERNYCSRVCCSQAMKNILRLKQEYPKKNVYVLYRDIRTYGLLEPYYALARKSGALFFRFEEGKKPIVEKREQGSFKISVFDEILQKTVELPAQLLVLSVGIDALASNEQTARMLKVPLTGDGFFQEAHVKLRPVDFATEGVFVCGLAHGPKHTDESIAQAAAAAARALTLMTRDTISSEAHTAFIDEARCSGCGLCVEVCAYGAVEMDAEREVAKVNGLLCKGCGSCAATCLSGAIDLSGFTNRQIITELEELFTG